MLLKVGSSEDFSKSGNSAKEGMMLEVGELTVTRGLTIGPRTRELDHVEGTRVARAREREARARETRNVRALFFVGPITSFPGLLFLFSARLSTHRGALSPCSFC